MKVAKVAQRNALRSFEHAHHIKHWADGGETKPSNLVSLCGFHHRKVHEVGIQVQMLDDGAVRFVKLDGTMIDSDIAGCATLKTA